MGLYISGNAANRDAYWNRGRYYKRGGARKSFTVSCYLDSRGARRFTSPVTNPPWEAKASVLYRIRVYPLGKWKS